jgi:hypothetical protein
MEKVTWPTVISLAGQGIGKVCSHQASKALLETGN